MQVITGKTKFCAQQQMAAYLQIMHKTSIQQYALLASINYTALFTRAINTKVFGTWKESNSDKTSIWKFSFEKWSSRGLSGRIQQAKLSGGPFQHSEDVFALSFQDNLLIHKM
jgi:hypothetical protein